MPLIVSFPGHGNSDVYQQNLTQLDDPLFNRDHIVVYPQGETGTDGKTAFSGAPYSDTTVDDLQFTDDLLNSVQQSYCVDTSRIFATGKSNGGGFVNFLACHPQSTRFAAFAPVTGAYYPGFGADGSSCKPARSPQPFLEIHGLNDSVIPYDGGKDHGLELPHLRHFVREWAGRNGCTNNATKTTQDNGLVEVFDFDCNTKQRVIRGHGLFPERTTNSFEWYNLKVYDRFSVRVQTLRTWAQMNCYILY